MDHHQLARLLAAGRLVIGCVAIAAPRRSLRVWLGTDPTGDVHTVARIAGVRDVALAVGALRGIDEGGGARWVASAAACDAVDGLATLAGIGRRHPARALMIAGVCAAAAFAGAAAAREIG